MYTYTAYNLCIESEILLSELIEAEGVPDVTIRLGRLNHITKETLDCGNQVFGTIPEIGTILIEKGQTITIDPAVGIDESMLSPSILGPIMSVVLRQRGLLVLHASSVVINGQAIAFLGGSGWGKSTLAESFHKQGYAALTDDVMAVQTSSTPPTVFPSFPQFKLWPEAAASLGHDVNRLPHLFANAPKLSYTFTQGFQQTPQPLQCIYVLSKKAQQTIIPLSPQEAFAELVRHTRAVNLLKSPEFVTIHLHQCARLAELVRFCRFTRPPSLAALADQVALIEDDLSQVGSQRKVAHPSPLSID